MRAKVFCVLKKFVQELRDKEGVRVLRNGGMEVECRLSEVRKDGLRVIYAITPKHPVSGNHYFELQVVERGEKNIGEVITNFSGKKLRPWWRAKNTVGFRTSRGQLISVIGYAVTGRAELMVYTFQVEGRTVYLAEEMFGPYSTRYDYDDDSWVVALPPKLEQLAEAVVAALEKAECNCYKKGCAFHYALSEEEAKKVLAERRERQKAAAEAQKAAEKPAEEPTGEEEIAAEESAIPEPVAAEMTVPDAVEAPAPVEPAVEVPAAEPVPVKKTKKATKKAAKKAE